MRILSFVPLSFVVACSPIQSATFSTHPPRPDGAAVRVFAGQEPVCDYEEIGLVMWAPQHALHDLEDGVRRLRDRAREMGGDAIIDFRVGSRESGVVTRISGDSTSTTARTTIQRQTGAGGTVVRWIGDGC